MTPGSAGLAVVRAVWAMLPAYLPNSAAVLVGGGPPIDGGRCWRGKRLLGDGKTWRGALGGVLAGTLLAGLLDRVAPRLPVAVPRFGAGPALALPAGAMIGDAAGSSLKRRLGREQGAPAPVLDQPGFLAGALAAARLVAPGWVRATFTPGVTAAALVLTPGAHLVANALTYLLGLKQVPW